MATLVYQEKNMTFTAMGLDKKRYQVIRTAEVEPVVFANENAGPQLAYSYKLATGEVLVKVAEGRFKLRDGQLELTSPNFI
jgi:hypothetical protein